MTDVQIADRPDRKRFEALVGGELAGWADYQLTDELMVFTHTEVDPAYEGRGVGGALARTALDEVRARGLKALVVCPFITGWIGRHREYADLLYGARPSSVSD
ncbi:GNAT family N-acetyltransferase [Nocardioides sp. BYT-33-1]|jgi:predicted GNAT family acetyltransferase|uniref:GNAT family N-acetyltransferase n=1 Tax=Nocardioides sp. BYT-33-1 TaxID=3416952 RepID=UPI003F531237